MDASIFDETTSSLFKMDTQAAHQEQFLFRNQSPPASQVIDVDNLPSPSAPRKQRLQDADMTDYSGSGPRELLTKDDFIPNFVPRFQGFNCHFLRKNAYQVLKCFSTAVTITSNESLAIFNLPEIQRRRLASRCEMVMELGKQDDAQTFRNPFTPTGTNGTVFVRLASNTRYFKETNDFRVVPMSRSDIQQGRSYAARVAMLLKGVKINNQGHVSPMLAVGQILIMQRFSKDNMLDQDECVLADPLTDEDEEDENTDPDHSAVNEIL